MPQTVVVVTAAQTQDLTTLDAVEGELGLTPGADATVDAALALLITHASSKCRSFCRRRSFGRQTYEETIDGLGQQIMLLSETPIVVVRDLNKLGDEVPDYTLRDPEVGTLYRDLAFDLSAEMGSPFRDWPIPDSAVQPYSCTYDGGYLLPSDEGQWGAGQGDGESFGADAQPLPDLVERACILTVKDWWLRRLEGGQRIKSKSVDDLRLEYADPTAVGELPTPAAGCLHDFIRDA